MKLIYKCRLIRYKIDLRQVIEIKSHLGVTKKEIRNNQMAYGWVVERFLINIEDEIFNDLKNKGYNVLNMYIPTLKNQYKEINDFYGVDVEFYGHIFLGYSVTDVKKKLKTIKEL